MIDKQMDNRAIAAVIRKANIYTTEFISEPCLKLVVSRIVAVTEYSGEDLTSQIKKQLTLAGYKDSAKRIPERIA